MWGTSLTRVGWCRTAPHVSWIFNNEPDKISLFPLVVSSTSTCNLAPVRKLSLRNIKTGFESSKNVADSFTCFLVALVNWWTKEICVGREIQVARRLSLPQQQNITYTSCVSLSGWLTYTCLKKDVYGFVTSVISWTETFGFRGVMLHHRSKAWSWLDSCLTRVLHTAGICNVVTPAYLS